MSPSASTSGTAEHINSATALPTPPVQVQLGTRTALQLLREARP